MEENAAGKALLYDPIFAKKPPEGWEDSEKGGFFGKASTKKALFIIFLVMAISFSLLLSFKSLSKKKFSYDNVESGCRLSEFNGTDSDSILSIVYAENEDGVEDTSRPVTAVRNYAVCCNGNLDFIFIGKDVVELEYNCFYYCTKLKAVFVDEENPNYRSVDGVVYNRDMTEIILHPIKNSEYRTALAMGLEAPVDADSCADFLREFDGLFPLDANKMSEEVKNAISETGALYTVPDTVTDVAPFCFSYCDKLTKVELPEGVKTIGQMSFFRCVSLESLRLPDTLESIGPDGLSYCEKLTYIFVPESVKTIGHHAFFGCLGVDEIDLGAESRDLVETGESWLPKTDKKKMKNVPAVYGAERRDG